jgi:hypothetical protein
MKKAPGHPSRVERCDQNALLFDYEQFPVLRPRAGKAIRRGRCSRGPDLSKHVLLDFETVLCGRPWYDWQQWSEAVGVRGVKAAGYLRFSHYDQVMAAIKGGGVAIGKRPHLSQDLRGCPSPRRSPRSGHHRVSP